MPKQKKKSKNGNQLTKTPKSGIMRGVGKYVKGNKITRAVKGRGGFLEDVGAKAGTWLGSKAGGFLSKIFGLGTYQVSKNSLTASASDPPQVTNTSGATRVQHREFIQDVSGSTTFVIQAFPVNPGISQTFPWLSSVANCFEEYVLHGLLFEFKSTSASALDSTNTALGTVILATEYNALHPNFVSKRDMENYVYSTSSPPSMSALHPVECARDVNVLSELYVRNVPPSLPTDLRFSDLGRFQIATVGMQAAAVIGELWVTYDIELIKPKLPDAYNSVGPSHYVFSDVDVIPNPNQGAPTAASFFGASGQKVQLLGIGLSAVTLATNTITFNTSGRFIVMIIVQQTANGAMTQPGYTLANSITGFTLFHKGVVGPTSDTMAPEGATNTLIGMTAICVDVTAGLTDIPTIVLTGAVYSSTITGIDLFIIPLPTGFQEKLVPDPISYIHREMEILKRELGRLNLENREARDCLVHIEHCKEGQPGYPICPPVLSSTPGPPVYHTQDHPRVPNGTKETPSSFWRSA